jgi:phage shock protein PspC (stress-responsive transcriptional regulator)
MGEDKLQPNEEPIVVTGEVISGDTGPKRLLRSSKNRVVSGVCAGIAEYFNLDPVLVRAAWTFLTVITAIIPGVLLYFLAVVIVPESATGERSAATGTRLRIDNRLLWGGILILAGVYFLSRMIWGSILPPEWHQAWDSFWGVARALIFPMVLIGAGLLLVLGLSRRSGNGNVRLARPHEGRILAGVCSGIARYFHFDAIWVRLVWVVLFFASWWAAVLGYVVAMLLMPED